MFPSDRALRGFARLLPREFTERIFEPAFLDLQRDERERTARSRRHRGARVRLILECCRLVVPFVLWRHGRPTRLARVLLLASGLGAVIVQRITYGRDHPAAPSPVSATSPRVSR